MSITPSPIAFPGSDSPGAEEVADWVESTVLLTGQTMKRGDLKATLDRESLRNPALVEEQTWRALSRRKVLFGHLWPLRLVGNRVRLYSTADPAYRLYVYLCLLSLGQFDPEDRLLFEELISSALGHQPGLRALRIGAPASTGFDPSFRARAATYVRRSRMAGLEVGAPPLAHDKDLGLDVAGWVPTGDRRGGELHFLVQCATGQDWTEKLNDIDLNVLRRHFAWSVPPVRIFSYPGVIDIPEEKWVRISDRAGLILDRPRLLGLFGRSDLDVELLAQVAVRSAVLADGYLRLAARN